MKKILFLCCCYLCSCAQPAPIEVEKNGGTLLTLTFEENSTDQDFLKKRFVHFFELTEGQLMESADKNEWTIAFPNLVNQQVLQDLIYAKGAIKVEPPRGRSATFLAQLENLESIVLKKNQGSGEDVILLTFDENAQKAWADMTTEHVKQTINIGFNGRVISSPRVSTPITNGNLMISQKDKNQVSAIYATLKNPSSSSPSVNHQVAYLLKGEESAQQISPEQIEAYTQIQGELIRRSKVILSGIKNNAAMSNQEKNELNQDIRLIMQNDWMAYLNRTQLSFKEFSNVLRNARIVMDANN